MYRGELQAESRSHPVSHRRIRIAFVVHRFDTGGQERCIAALVNHLPERLFDPVVVSFQEAGAACDWIERPNVPILSLRKQRPNDPRIITRLAKVLKRGGIDIAHSHNWGTLVETALACRITRTRHVHAEHGLEFGRQGIGWRGGIKHALQRRFFNQSDALVAIAECVKSRLLETFQIPAGRVSLIPNGVPAPLVPNAKASYSEIRHRLGLPADSLIAGTVGRVAYVKGYDNAIRGFSSIAKRMRGAHLVIVGDGPEMHMLQDLCRELDVADRVHLVGHQHDVGHWLAAFDLFFNSSRSEAMNLAILEAMAVGLPIVAMDVGDNAALVSGHGKCGAVVESGSVTGFAEAVLHVLGDPSVRVAFGAEAAKVYQRAFTVERMVESYSEVYQRLMEPEADVSFFPQGQHHACG